MTRSPFDIGYDVYRNGGGVSDLWGAVKSNDQIDDAYKGYLTALNDAKNIPTLTEIVMDEDNNEVMDIAQEECAEVIQAISKIRRFGMDNAKPGTDYTNRQHLEEELGDVLAMIDILMINEVVSWGNLHKAKRAKIEKLKKWSNIPNLDKI